MKANVSQTETAKQPIKLYTAKEAAKLWGISYWSLRNLVIDGTIRPIIGIGKGWYFDGSELKLENLKRL